MSQLVEIEQQLLHGVRQCRNQRDERASTGIRMLL